MSRADQIANARAEVAELGAKFRMGLPEPLLAKAKDLKLARFILSPPKAVLPCAASIEGLGYRDPCLIVPASLPIELLPSHNALAVGGQVVSLERSMYAMSSYMIDEAARAQGYWNGEPMPMLVAIGGSYKYLVRQRSFFFKFENYVGSDIDQLSPMAPDVMSLKLRRYHWGDDLSSELLIVLAEYDL